MFRCAAILCFLLGITLKGAESPAPTTVLPKEIGSRNVVVDFTVDAAGNQQPYQIVSSEAERLNPWAKALIRGGQLKVGSPGVTQIGEGKYRALISFPLEGDSAPLAKDITPPVPKLQLPPVYPFELAKSGTCGAALFKLTIDESGKIKNVELVRTSHALFAKASKEALQKWRFSQPAKKAGAPIAVTLYQLLVFVVEGKPLPSWQYLMSPEPALPEFLLTTNFIPAN
jgi:hypothetical protein